MNDLFAADATLTGILWMVCWQSSVWLAAGLLLSRMLARRAARAHLALLIVLIAAVVSPLLTLGAASLQWGMLSPRPVTGSPQIELVQVPELESRPLAIASGVKSDAGARMTAAAGSASINSASGDSSGTPSAEATAQRQLVQRDFQFREALLFAIAGWSVASFLLIVRLLRGIVCAVRLVRRAEPVADQRLLHILRSAADRLKLGAPRLVTSPDCRCPMIWCWGRQPVVIVPVDAPQQSSLAWDAIFCHELAHRLRRDHAWDLCGEMVLIAIPWQPLAWLSRSWLSAYGEQACDDWSLACDNDAVDYAETLLSLVPQGSSTAVLAAVTSHASLAYRVRRLLVDGVHVPAAGRLWSCVMGVAALVTVCGLALAQPASAPQVESNPASTNEPASAAKIAFVGTVVDDQGRPVAGANVAAIMQRRRVMRRGGDLHRQGKFVVEAVCGDDGRFQLELPGIEQDESEAAAVVARAPGFGLAWKSLDLALPGTIAPLRLAKEQLIKGRLIDVDGQPAVGVRLRPANLVDATVTPPVSGTSYVGDNPPAAWPADTVTDTQGRFTVSGIGVGHGVSIDVDATDHIAPQSMVLNTGMPETRGKRDGTYRPSIVRNLKPGEEPTFVLAPAQPISGTMRYEDSGEPVRHGRLSVFASEQEYGSWIGLSGDADAEGRYRVIPHPGSYFEVTAYPPDGEPYLIRKQKFKWDGADKAAKTDLTLPRGVLIRGLVYDASTKQPIENATIEYRPQGDKGEFGDDNVVTGWQAKQISDAAGKFEIAVFPGPGHLLVHAPQATYVMHEIGDKELSYGKPGGQRQYAHAIQRIDPAVGSEPVDLQLALTPSVLVTGTVVDDQGRPIDNVEFISRLNIYPIETHWRGYYAIKAPRGAFKIGGWNGDTLAPVSFVVRDKQLGATVELGARNAGQNVVVQLKPYGSVTTRFVDQQGKPVAEYEPTVQMVVTPGPQNGSEETRNGGQLAADTDFISNVDRHNHDGFPTADKEGKMTIPALIPGATYRLIGLVNGHFVILKEFVAEADKTIDLGDVQVPAPEND